MIKLNRTTSSILLNPKDYLWKFPDEESRQIMMKTIEFFEKKGLAALKKDDHESVWYQDFLDFVAKEKIFSRLMTPTAYGTSGCRWDSYRNCAFNEILGFYGLVYWYTWQVTMLGLGPIWMGKNEEVKKKTAQLLKDGGIFAFGLSEKEHGADIYSTEMKLIPQKDGTFLARGRKYYIGNANKAAYVSTLGKIEGIHSGKDEKDAFAFFVVESNHEKYECVKNTVNSQNYVAEYALHDYPITQAQILTQGTEAWDSSLNTINFCKFNLGWASIGIATHSFYEAIAHASKRNLFGQWVTDFPHIKQLFVDAYARLVAMKLFALRASDYMRVASEKDRRYLLFNPMVKMKVTTQGEEVVNLLWDVIAAKGYEKDVYFETATRDIRCLPKLEGTVHVNMALIIKFMGNYFFKPTEYADVPRQDQAASDDYLFHQGPTKGLGGIRFNDYKKVYDSWDLPNVKIFKKQISTLKKFLMLAKPNDEQNKDFDFLLNLGELFTLVVYGQLVLENARLSQTDEELVDQIFDFMIRDFSAFALKLFSKTSSTTLQKTLCLLMIKKPAVNPARFNRIWNEQVYPLKDAYEMNP